MATLHIVNKSSGFASCLTVAAAADTILLIEDGVYCATRPGNPAVSAIAEDVAARGLGNRIDDNVTLIGFEAFVDLVVSHQPVVSWS